MAEGSLRTSPARNAGYTPARSPARQAPTATSASHAAARSSMPVSKRTVSDHDGADGHAEEHAEEGAGRGDQHRLLEDGDAELAGAGRRPPG